MSKSKRPDPEQRHIAKSDDVQASACPDEIHGKSASVGHNPIQAVPNRPMRRRLMSTAAAAEELDVCRHTVYRMVARGELPGHRIGRQIRIDPRDLAALLTRSLIGG